MWTRLPQSPRGSDRERSFRTSLAAFDDLVQGIYDAALEPEKWGLIVKSLADLMGAPMASMHAMRHSNAEGGFQLSHNIPPRLLAQFDRKFVHKDPFVAAAVRMGVMTEGFVSRGSDLVPDQELLRTEFYQALWKPAGIHASISGVVFDSTDSRKMPTSLSLFRTRSDPAFTPEDVDLARRLVNHVSRALGVMFHLRDREWRVAASLSALDQLSAGIVLLDRAREIRHANRAAHALFARGTAPIQLVRTSGGGSRLVLADRLHSFVGNLERAIDSAFRHSSEDIGEHFSLALVLPSAAGRPACVVHVAPLARSQPFVISEHQPLLIVFIYDLETAGTVSLELLIEEFGLTHAEARAAIQILQGGTVKEMANRLGVSVNTLKSQLKDVYSKTGSQRQVDLLKLLLSLARG